ncbi:hypothetical protein HanXRQr2_Chr03g0094191 [Helianthus annuus]|uniref:Secreted protein n=1 Tax=Helianthus annuus TaxID=4232 RepID=A0A9K3JDT8_HELAN|nr:hypothetical protein HanXRQr2_Chr03g0094191 [Helianthus annuus]KAJ0606879.1 hypothetical protein HanHA89_Chr03g0090101 [Helianthus annuus]
MLASLTRFHFLLEYTLTGILSLLPSRYVTLVSEPELGVVAHRVVAWREPAVTNVAVTNEARSGGPWSGGLERASRDQHGRDQHGRDQRGRWPLRRVDCYGLIPLQGMGLVPHRLYGQPMWGLYTKWALSSTRPKCSPKCWLAVGLKM